MKWLVLIELLVIIIYIIIKLVFIIKDKKHTDKQVNSVLNYIKNYLDEQSIEDLEKEIGDEEDGKPRD